MPKRTRITTNNQQLPFTNTTSSTLLKRRSKDKPALSASRARTEAFFARFLPKKKPKAAKKKTAKRKIYRKTKRLRPCARKLFFLVPLAILVLERCIGKLLKTEHVTDFYYEQNGVEPWHIHHTAKERVGIPPDIPELTASSSRHCPRLLRYVANVYHPQSLRSTDRRIPRIIHQTSKSRCLTTNFYRSLMKWKFHHWSLYFYDEDAVDRLLLTQFPEFPHLKVVVQNCATTHQLKLDLWRFLVLWVYGGLVPDLNTFPKNFHGNTILPNDDGFFLIDSETIGLSTKVIAVSPRHPFIYYTMQHTLANILKLGNISSNSETSIVTGPNGALTQALFSFRGFGQNRTDGSFRQTVGTVDGLQNRSLRIVGGSEEYFDPIFISEQGKKKELLKMGVEMTASESRHLNCFDAIYKKNLKS